MTAKPETLSCEAVLSEMRWLRGLAKSLGADAHTADDLSQPTVLKVLEHPPETDRSVRGWLRTVLGNRLRKSRRTRIRREAREARAARPESGASTFDVVARAAIQREVSDAVMALDEPYRSTVLLRFFEELPPRRIASLLGVPVATVKTRLARALDQLREQLDRAHGGDRRSWFLCLLAPLP
jgi:RNA polymerase sigma-70 factor (ECF subfamily)